MATIYFPLMALLIWFGSFSHLVNKISPRKDRFKQKIAEVSIGISFFFGIASIYDIKSEVGWFSLIMFVLLIAIAYLLPLAISDGLAEHKNDIKKQWIEVANFKNFYLISIICFYLIALAINWVIVELTG